MNEKTTVYLEPDLKKSVQVKLLSDYEGKSLSALLNELLSAWYSEHKKSL